LPGVSHAHDVQDGARDRDRVSDLAAGIIKVIRIVSGETRLQCVVQRPQRVDADLASVLSCDPARRLYTAIHIIDDLKVSL
jgi:hypothetical protein